jgi:two-component system cell cycle response regulator DivK
MKASVLIFDDDADLLDICSIVLKSRGLEVTGRINCTEIIKDLETCRPNVIIMDNWIPDKGGVKAIQVIKSIDEFKDIPVIFFTANTNIEQLASEAGADYFLQKPFELSELENLVDEAVRKHKALNV